MVDIQDTEEELKKSLFELVPGDGSTIGNVTLSQKFKKTVKEKHAKNINDSVYWDTRDLLIDEGQLSTGRGRGGAVYRIMDVKPIAIPSSKKKKTKKKKEQELYAPFYKVIEASWARSKNIKPGQFVLNITANQGKAKTGGKWTRPDISLIHVQTLPFYPTKILDVITFEIKTEDNWGIEGVYETASHSVFANKAYYAIHLPKGEPTEEHSDWVEKRSQSVDQQYSGVELDLFGRVKKECERFGVGLMIFSDPGNWGTYDTLIEPERRIPDPEEVSKFISQLKEKEREAIRAKW